MRILAIETSTPRGTVALLDSTRGIAQERQFTSHRAHNARIFAPLKELRAMQDGPADLVVIGAGPGSYSGVRVGIAVANGLAMADNCPAIALPSIAALDIPAQEQLEDFDVVGDARRGSFFHVRIRHGQLQETRDLLLEESAFHASIAAATHEIFTMDETPPHSSARTAQPRALLLAALAMRLDRKEIASLSQLPLQPIYLRAPFTSTAKKRKLPGA